MDLGIPEKIIKYMAQQKYLLGFLLLLASSCATFKKVQIIQDAVSKSDTTKRQFVTEIKKVDSLAIVKNILSKIAIAKLDYKTMNARIKVEYESSKSAVVIIFSPNGCLQCFP